MPDHFDIVVIGAGIVGLATARALHRRAPDTAIAVVEKESDVGQHQTGHNSGVIHSGAFYPPGSLKSRLTLSGRRDLLEFCRQHGVPVRPVGKLVVARNERERSGLTDLQARAAAVGIPDVTWLDARQLRDRFPGGQGAAALSIPSASVVSFEAVAQRLAAELRRAGVSIRTASTVGDFVEEPGRWTLRTSLEELRAELVVNCAGLQSDLVAAAMGSPPPVAILPFRGEYVELEGPFRDEVRTLIYPVPDPRVPFLGVHLTPTLDGRLLAGPTATLALHRQGYRRGSVDPAELLRLARFPGIFRLLRNLGQSAGAGWLRSWSAAELRGEIARLLPDVRPEHIGRRHSGVRAQAVRPDGRFEDDFVVMRGHRSLHVVNAPSPAATASFSIGDYVAAEIDRRPGPAS